MSGRTYLRYNSYIPPCILPVDTFASAEATSPRPPMNIPVVVVGGATSSLSGRWEDVRVFPEAKCDSGNISTSDSPRQLSGHIHVLLTAVVVCYVHKLQLNRLNFCEA